MEETHSSLSNNSKFITFSKSPSLSSSSTTDLSNHESHSTTAPTLSEEDSSFNSLDQSTGSITNHPLIPKSHFCIASLKTLTPQMITCLAVQNHSLYVATVKGINVFNLHSFVLEEKFGPGSGWVRSIVFDQGKIFTAHQDSKIRVWKAKIASSGEQKHRLISTLPTFKDCLFKSVSTKNYIQTRCHRKKLWVQHSDAISGLAVNTTDGLLYSTSWDRSFKVWKMSNTRCLESIRAHSDAINAIIVSNGIVYTGSADGHVKAWKPSEDGKRHNLVTSMEKHKSSINALATLAGSGMGVCSGGGDSVIFVWKWGECRNRMVLDCALEGHKGAVLCLANVGRLLVSGSADRSVRVWKCGEGFGECLGVLEGHSRPVKSLVGVDNPGGDLMTVVSGSLDGEIRAWKVVVRSDG